MSILAKLCLTPRESHAALLATYLEQYPDQERPTDSAGITLKALYQQPLTKEIISSIVAALNETSDLDEVSWVRLSLFCDRLSDKTEIVNLANKLVLNTSTNEKSRLNAYYFLRSQNHQIPYLLNSNHILSLILRSDNKEAWVALLSDANFPEHALQSTAVDIVHVREFAIPLLKWLSENNDATITKQVLARLTNMKDFDICLSLIAQGLSDNGSLEIIRDLFATITNMEGDDLFYLFFMAQKLAAASTPEEGEKVIRKAFEGLTSLMSDVPEEDKTKELINLFIIPALQTQPQYFIHVLHAYPNTKETFKHLPQAKAFMQLQHFFHPEAASAEAISSDIADISVLHDSELFFNFLAHENALNDLSAMTNILVSKIEAYKTSSAERRSSGVSEKRQSNAVQAERKNIVGVDSGDYTEFQSRFNALLVKARGNIIEPTTPTITAEKIEQTQQQAFALHEKIKTQLSPEQITALNQNPCFAKYSLAYRILTDIDALPSKLRAIGEFFNIANKPFGKEIKIPFLIWIFENFDALNNHNMTEPSMIFQAYTACNPATKALSSQEKAIAVNAWLDLVLTGTSSTKTQDTIKPLPLNIRVALFAGTKWESLAVAKNESPKKATAFSDATVFGGSAATSPKTNTNTNTNKLDL